MTVDYITQPYFFQNFVHSRIEEIKNVQRNDFSAGVSFSAVLRSFTLCQKFWVHMQKMSF